MRLAGGRGQPAGHRRRVRHRPGARSCPPVDAHPPVHRHVAIASAVRGRRSSPTRSTPRPCASARPAPRRWRSSSARPTSTSTTAACTSGTRPRPAAVAAGRRPAREPHRRLAARLQRARPLAARLHRLPPGVRRAGPRRALGRLEARTASRWSCGRHASRSTGTTATVWLHRPHRHNAWTGPDARRVPLGDGRARRRPGGPGRRRHRHAAGVLRRRRRPGARRARRARRLRRRAADASWRRPGYGVRPEFDHDFSFQLRAAVLHDRRRQRRLRRRRAGARAVLRPALRQRRRPR